MKKNPREYLKELSDKNGDEGFYGTYNQFIILEEKRLYEKATKIMNSLNQGFLWENERLVHSKIYNDLLDGILESKIKGKFK